MKSPYKRHICTWLSTATEVNSIFRGDPPGSRRVSSESSVSRTTRESVEFWSCHHTGVSRSMVSFPLVVPDSRGDVGVGVETSTDFCPVPCSGDRLRFPKSQGREVRGVGPTVPTATSSCTPTVVTGPSSLRRQLVSEGRDDTGCLGRGGLCVPVTHRPDSRGWDGGFPGDFGDRKPE